MPSVPEGREVDHLLRRALAEDIGTGDRTSLAVVGPDRRARASLIARSPCVLAGLPIAERVFTLIDPAIRFEQLRSDGEQIEAGTVAAKVSGRARSILAGERVALNFLQRLSGIASATAAYVAAVGSAACEITETRKTTPGLRWLEKYAVQAGGGRSHRFGLDDGILIKDNHLRITGGVKAAVEAVRSRERKGTPIEVEVESLDELREALAVHAEAVLLDNLPVGAVREAVAIVRAYSGTRPKIEVSGKIGLESTAELAALGVDRISAGALTHSAPAADIALEFE